MSAALDLKPSRLDEICDKIEQITNVDDVDDVSVITNYVQQVQIRVKFDQGSSNMKIKLLVHHNELAAFISSEDLFLVPLRTMHEVIQAVKQEFGVQI